MRIALLVAACLFMVVAIASFGAGVWVLGNVPQPHATQGMFGCCTVCVFSLLGVFLCGYRVRYGEWP